MSDAGESAAEDRSREYILGWARAGEALKAVRRRELAELTDEEALVMADDLLRALDALPRQPLRRWSGLVEQQRLFAKLRGK